MAEISALAMTLTLTARLLKIGAGIETMGDYRKNAKVCTGDGTDGKLDVLFDDTKKGL